MAALNFGSLASFDLRERRPKQNSEFESDSEFRDAYQISLLEDGGLPEARGNPSCWCGHISWTCNSPR